MSSQARKPISMMSSRLIEIIPNLGQSKSIDTMSPGGQFAKADGDDVSRKSVCKRFKDDDSPTLDELKTIEAHRQSLLLRVSTYQTISYQLFLST